MKNESGIIELCEYKILILPDLVEAKTEGGIWKPDTVRDKEKYQTCRGTVILRSENAFRDWGGYIPEPGDRVYVAVASGLIHEGPDGKTYRICNDKDVLGRIDDEAWDKEKKEGV
jgi:co-chaperonin GroES (HSP10)